MYNNNYIGPGINQQPVPLYCAGGKNATSEYQQYIEMQLQTRSNDATQTSKNDLIEALGSLPSIAGEEIYQP